MSSSEQQPTDESKMQANEEPLEAGEQEEQVAFQPFYEFPPAAVQPPLDDPPPGCAVDAGSAGRRASG